MCHLIALGNHGINVWNWNVWPGTKLIQIWSWWLSLELNQAHTDIWKYEQLRMKKKKEMMVVWVRKIGISVLLNGLNIAFWGRKAQPADFSCSSPSSRVKQFYKNTGWYTWGGSSCFSGIPSGEEGSPAIQMGSGKGRRRGEKAGMGKRAWDLMWHLLSILFSALATLFFRTP